MRLMIAVSKLRMAVQSANFSGFAGFRFFLFFLIPITSFLISL